MKLSDQLEGLASRQPEPWRIEREQHSYKDGTSHFTHVVHDAADSEGAKMKIMIGRYLTPDLAELLVTMKNNLPQIIAALRKDGQ